MRDELALRRQCLEDFRALVARFPQLRQPARQARFTAYVRKHMNTDGDSMPPKDYRAMGEDLVGIAVRVPASIMDEIDAHVERLRAASRWAKVGRSDALRDLILRALESLATPAPPASMPHTVQTPLGETRRQTETVPVPRGEGSQQTETLPALAEAMPQQTDRPPYDASKYRLGKLCPAQHDYHGTGQSLLRRNNQRCRECDRLGKRAARAKRQ